MSKIGKIPVTIPENVKAEVTDKKVVIEGTKGSLTIVIPNDVKVSTNDGVIKIESTVGNMQGLVKMLIANAAKGVSVGWTKVLELSGTGFRAAVNGDQLQLNLGFSHQVTVTAPQGIEFGVKENKITVSGADKSLVGQIAATIRQLKPADVYKAKGFKYQGETILRKPGKAAKAGATK